MPFGGLGNYTTSDFQNVLPLVEGVPDDQVEALVLAVVARVRGVDRRFGHRGVVPIKGNTVLLNT